MPKSVDITEILQELSAAVSDTQEKQDRMDSASAAFSKAADEYQASKAKVEDLQSSLSTMLGGMFKPGNPRVKVA